MRFARFSIITIFYSCLLAFVLTLLLRASFFVFTPTFSYLKIGTYTHIRQSWNGWQVWPGDPRNWEHALLYGHPVYGKGGFPFSVFADCRMWGLRNEIAPRPVIAKCESFSKMGEWSVLLNGLFWLMVFLGLWWLQRAIRFYKNKESTLLLGQ